ncbi:MAG: TetR family transcriptional regulator [Gammaproteobacteria bacterium]
MARRTKQEAQATRAAILDAAERLFHERGVARTTLQHVAQAAGVTRGAIYWHFADKADLFNAMMERVYLPLEQTSAMHHPVPGEPPLEALRRDLLDLFARTVTDAQLRRVFEIALQRIEHGEAMAPVRERLQQAGARHLAQVEAALQRAGAPRREVRALALGLHALVDGLLRQWIPDPGAFDLCRVGQAAVDTYLGGVRAAVGRGA